MEDLSIWKEQMKMDENKKTKIDSYNFIIFF